MLKYKALFFDLDGTLVDTAPDMGLALNLLLTNHKIQPLKIEYIRRYVSHGSEALIKLGFNITNTDIQFESLKQAFLDFYEHNIAVKSALFDGISTVLDQLDDSAIPWGIVTNKPGYLTELLLKHLGLDQRVACVISGDTLKVKKPHPGPLLAACDAVKTDPALCLYIGDAQRDIEAAHAAGMKSCAALYGYYTDKENPFSWNANFNIATPVELLDHIKLEHIYS